MRGGEGGRWGMCKWCLIMRKQQFKALLRGHPKGLGGEEKFVYRESGSEEVVFQVWRRDIHEEADGERCSERKPWISKRTKRERDMDWGKIDSACTESRRSISGPAPRSDRRISIRTNPSSRGLPADESGNCVGFLIPELLLLSVFQHMKLNPVHSIKPVLSLPCPASISPCAREDACLSSLQVNRAVGGALRSAAPLLLCMNAGCSRWEISAG